VVYSVIALASEDEPISDERQESILSILAPNQIKWLRRERVLAMRFRGMPAEVQLLAVKEQHPVDLFVVEGEAPIIPCELMVCDMDSTVIEQECIDELADFAGLRDPVEMITEAAMRGEIEFEPALRERVALLKGLPESTLQQVFDERLTLSKNVEWLTKGMKRTGARCVLISGGFTFFTERVAIAAGFDAHYGNRLEIENGVLTGKVIEPILSKDSKLQIMQYHAQDMGIAPTRILAVGDGANDIPMLEAAGVGIAYRAKPDVKKAANYSLDHADLEALLWVQGYKSTA